MVTRALPDGDGDVLLTDVESSTRLWESYPDVMPSAVALHDALIEQAVEAHRGQVVRQRSEGDRRFAVFARATDAVAAAAVIQQALHAEAWPGEVPLRVLAHGGQVLVSEATRDLIRDVPLPALG